MSNHDTHYDYRTIGRRNSFLSEDDVRQHHRERSNSRDINRRHRHHNSRSDWARRDRSPSPYHSQKVAERIESSEYQSSKRRRHVRDKNEQPRRYRSSNPSSSDRSRSPRDDHRHSNRSRINRSQSPSRQSYESDSNNRQHKSSRRQSLSPNPRPRHRTSRDHQRTSKHHKPNPKSPHRHLSPPSPIPKSPPNHRSKAPLPSQHDQFHQTTTQPPPPQEKQKPNYEPSGKLAAETNTVANTSIVLKYHEPPAARLPPASAPWRLYIYKGSALLETLRLQTRSCWLFGRERLVVDVPVEHPSCSKQHAVIQFRHVEAKNAFGDRVGGVRPYVIDLDSANGTRVNGDLLPGRQYVELKSGDLLGFGDSSREYVLLLPPKD